MLSTGYTGWRSNQYRFLVLTAYGMFNRGRLGGWLRGLCRTELVPCKRGGAKGLSVRPGEMVTLIIGEI